MFDECIRSVLLWRMRRTRDKLGQLLSTNIPVGEMTMDHVNEVVTYSEKLENMVVFYDSVLPPDRDACKICVIC